MNLRKKSICLVVVFLLVHSFIFAWDIYQHKDQFGDPNGKYFLYDQGVYFEIAGSMDNGYLIDVTFGSSEYGYYQARGYRIDLKETNGTVHSYRTTISPTLSDSEAIEIYDIFLRNGTTKVYVYYDYGYGYSFTLEVHNDGLSDGIERLISLYKPTPNGKHIEKPFIRNDGKQYLLDISLNPYPSSLGIGYLIDVSVLKYSSDNKFVSLYIAGDARLLSSFNQYNRLDIICGEIEKSFIRSNKYDSLVDESTRGLLDTLLTHEITTISIPDYNISVEVPTDELRSLLGFISLEEKSNLEKGKEELEPDEEDNYPTFYGSPTEATNTETDSGYSKQKKLSFSFVFSIGFESEPVTSEKSSEKNPDGNCLINAKYTQKLFNFGVIGVALDGSFGKLGSEMGISPELGISFKYLQLGFRFPLRYGINNSSFDFISPQLFLEGFIPINRGGLVIGITMSLIPEVENAKLAVYFGYSIKTRNGSFSDWWYN